MALHSLSLRHIQNFSEAESLQHHWGYASRAVPCTNDPGSCEYLDSVYHSHDLGMLYTFIMWAAIGGVLFIWGIGRHFIPLRQSHRYQTAGEHSAVAQGGLYRLSRSIAATFRVYLQPDASRLLFGPVSRLQVLVLLILASYLTVFTFVGIVYKKWVTPVTDMPGVYNTRTGLGPWSDRIGVLAYALIPFSVLLSSRESVLSLITGIPYQHFNFLHRWLGYIIYIQSTLHTIGWTIVEGKLYQPQPSEWNGFIAQTYMVWGVVAMIFMSFLFFFSTPWAIRWTGYEFFHKAHYVVAMLFVGACWGHWAQLYCWLVASLVLWFVDRGVRLVRTGLLHYGYIEGSVTKMGFQCAQAVIEVFPDAKNGDVVRLSFQHNHQPWKVGQHFYLCFPEISIWQSHPFTPSTLPTSGKALQPHTYIMRAKKGETRKLAEMAKAKVAEHSETVTTPVILTGPYGLSTVGSLQNGTDMNVLCVAGGSGITFVLPVLQRLLHEPRTASSRDRKVELIWAVRRRSDLNWIRSELDTLRGASQPLKLTVRIFVTREDVVEATVSERKQPMDAPGKEAIVKIEGGETSDTPDSASLSTEMEKDAGGRSFSIEHATYPAATSPEARHPDLNALLTDFISSTVRGPTCVYGSGPGGMISDLRSIVATCNAGSKVWNGDERYDVKFINDDRLEW